MAFSIWDYLLLVGFICILIYFYGTWNYDFFKKRNIKFVKPFPFLGNVGRLYCNVETFTELINKVYTAYPDQRYIGFYDLRTPSIWIHDPETIKQITVKDFDHFTDHMAIASENQDPLFTNNLFALKGQKWRDMRTTLSPAFTGSKMRNMFPFIAECAEQLVSYVGSECEISLARGEISLEMEMKDLYTRYTNDVIATSAFGIKVDSLSDKTNEFYSMGKKISNLSVMGFIKLMVYVIFPGLMKYLKISIMESDVANFFGNLVRSTMEAREINNIHRPDMIHLLMQAKKGSLKDDLHTSMNTSEEPIVNDGVPKRNWSDDDLTAQAFVFFLAGFETASTLLTFAAYELAANQGIQEKLRKEVNDVIEEGGLNYERMTKMKYMDMFVYETLRIWPPVPGIDRVCVKPYTLPPPSNDSKTGFEMKKSDRLFIPTLAIHRDPRYFENPNKFDPEHFLDESKIQPFTFMPFGSGPRICIGSRFALMEVKTALFYMISKFLLVPCPKTKDPTKWKMKLTSSIPNGGLWVGLKRRSETQ